MIKFNVLHMPHNGPFYQHGITCPVQCVCVCGGGGGGGGGGFIHSTGWATVEVWGLGMDKKFHPTLYNWCNHLFMLGLKIHIDKTGPRPQLVKWTTISILHMYNTIPVRILYTPNSHNFPANEYAPVNELLVCNCLDFLMLINIFPYTGVCSQWAL